MSDTKASPATEVHMHRYPVIWRDFAGGPDAVKYWRGHYVMFIQRAPQRFEVICFGGKSHRYVDGVMCRHTKDVLAQLKPWYRSRTTVVGMKHKAQETP